MPAKPPKLPKGAIQPRPAVVAMAPYSPPTARARRQTAARFQREHRRLLAARHRRPARRPGRGQAGRLPRIRRGQGSHRRATSAFVPSSSFSPTAPMKPSRCSSTPMWMTARRWCCSKPSYAMYRFYAEVAGGAVREVEYPPPGMEFPLEALLAAITPDTRAVHFGQPEQSHRHGRFPAGSGAHPAPRTPRRGDGGRSLLRILRRHRAD